MNSISLNKDNLFRSIHKNIKITKTNNQVDLELPFKSKVNKVTITFTPTKGKRDPKLIHSYRAKNIVVSENDSPEIKISDNGFAINELKEKVTDINKYKEIINRICHSYGFTLRAEQIIEKDYVYESIYDHYSNLNYLLKVVSQVCNLDLFMED